MLRKLIVVICLLSFLPAASGAQVVTTAPAAPATANAVTEARQPDLMLAAAKSATIVVAAATTTQSEATKTAPEQKRESHSSFNMSNFADVHLAEGRWIWWAGGIAALIALHVFVAD